MSNAMDAHTHIFPRLLCTVSHAETHKIQRLTVITDISLKVERWRCTICSGNMIRTHSQG